MRFTFNVLLCCGLGVGGARAEVVTDGSVGPALELSGPEFHIGAELGRQAGANLFHSFTAFSLERSQSATFSGPAGIENVIGRVTGGHASRIDGTLRSTLPAADLYLLNPAGLMFGPGARLDVPGGFHASTADSLEFSDGAVLQAHNSAPSTFSSAPPTAFGFLGAAPAPLAAEGSRLRVREGKHLSLTGGALTLREAQLDAPAGRLDLAALGAAGKLEQESLASDAPGADLELQASSLNTSGEGGGAIFLRGGRVVLDNSEAAAVTEGTRPGVGIEIHAAELVLANGGRLNTSTYGSAKGGDVHVEASGDVLIAGAGADGSRSRILSRSGDDSRSALGDAGDISVSAANLMLSDGGQISANTYTTGRGGDITVTAQERIEVVGATADGYLSSIAAVSYDETSVQAGAAGHIQVSTGELSLRDGGVISTSTIGRGRGGDVTIDAARAVSIGGESPVDGLPATILAGTHGAMADAGAAGTLHIQAPSVEVYAGGNITSSTSGPGIGGNLRIEAADHIRVSGEGSWVPSTISSDTLTSGPAGSVELHTARLEVADGGLLEVMTTGSGAGGRLSVHADTIELRGVNSMGLGSGIFGVQSNAGTGAAGSIDITASSLSIHDGALVEASTNGAGAGGDIRIQARALTLDGGAKIGASTNGPGTGGNLDLDIAGQVVLQGENSYGLGSSIGAESLGGGGEAGDSGNIRLRAQDLALYDGAQISALSWGTGKGGDVELDIGGSALLQGETGFGFASAIYANAMGTGDIAGDGGDIHLQAGRVTLQDGAEIGAATAGPGQGGHIDLNIAGKLVVQGENSWGQASNVYASSASEAADGGDGGGITLRADSLELLNGGQINASTSGGGDGGQLRLELDNRLHAQGENSSGLISGVRAETFGVGKGGGIHVDTRELALLEGAQISASSFGAGHGGDIHVEVTDSAHLQGEGNLGLLSAVAVEAYGQGNGGSITLQAGELSLHDGALISASSFGPGDSGDVAIRVSGSARVQGTGSAGWPSAVAAVAAGQNSPAGDGGHIRMSAETLELLDGGSISADTGGPGAGGDIDLELGMLRVAGSTKAGGGGGIATRSFSAMEDAGVAGSIRITADRLELQGALDSELDEELKTAEITTRTEAADGGNIVVTTPGYLYLDQAAAITTSVKAARGNGGNITIEPGFIVLKNGRISANAYEGDGGNIAIDTHGIYQFDRTPLDEVITASSEKGISGEIAIESPEVDISSGLTVLPSGFIDAAALQQTPCALKRGDSSSFIVNRYAGKRRAPEDWRSGCMQGGRP